MTDISHDARPLNVESHDNLPTRPQHPDCRPPMLVVGLGSAAIAVLRYLQDLWLTLAGCTPPFIRFLGLDTTGQSAVCDVPTLSEEDFENISNNPDLTRRVELALGDPDRRPPLPANMARLAGGSGACGSPTFALLMLELSLHKVLRRLTRTFDAFRGANRVRIVEASGQIPWLRDRGIQIAAEGPLDILFVTSAVGGTAGILKYVAALVQQRAHEMGLDLVPSLILSPPARGSLGTHDGINKSVRCYARLQELSDLNEGREIHWWPTKNYEVCSTTSLFKFAFLTPEPISNDSLDQHNRCVADIILLLTLPLGRAFMNKAADMGNDVFVLRSNAGQLKFLSSLGIARLSATAVRDPQRYANSCLGAAATASGEMDCEPVIDALLWQCKLSTEGLAARAPSLSPPVVPENVGPAGVSSFLTNQQSRLSGEGQKRAAESHGAVAESFMHLKKEFAPVCRKIGLAQGLGAAASAAQVVCRRLAQIEADAAARSASLPSGERRPASDAVGDRLRDIAAGCEMAAQRRYWSAVTATLADHSRVFAALHQRLSIAHEVVGSRHADYEEQVRSFATEKLAPHALIDKAGLDCCVASRQARCTLAVREALLQKIDAGGARDELLTVAEAIISATAEELAPLANLDAAARHVGPQAEVSMKNFLIAARPQIQLADGHEFPLGEQPWTFLTLSEQHPLAARVVSEDRAIRWAPSAIDPGEVVALTANFGYAVGELAMTAEASEAFASRQGGLPPFAEVDYVGTTDLVIPLVRWWWLYLAMPLHCCLQTGRLRYIVPDGWMWDDEALGSEYGTAFATLAAETNRRPGLPSVAELMREAKMLVWDGGTFQVAQDRLQAAAHLLNQLVTHCAHSERSIVMQQRAVAKAMLAETVERVVALRNYQQLPVYHRQLRVDGALPAAHLHRESGNGDTK